jgi:hypothetical protein
LLVAAVEALKEGAAALAAIGHQLQENLQVAVLLLKLIFLWQAEQIIQLPLELADQETLIEA